MDQFLKKMVASAPVMVEGQAGWYFKFGQAQSANGVTVDLFFKPKFVNAPYLVGDNLTNIDWLELNILVLSEELPDLPSPWEALRGGKYKRPTGDIETGVLIGKMFVPMGEFNRNIPAMHDHVLSICPAIEQHLTDNLLSKVFGKITHPLVPLFEYMSESLNKEKMVVEPKVYLNKDFSDYQKASYNASKAKYVADTPEADEDNE